MSQRSARGDGAFPAGNSDLWFRIADARLSRFARTAICAAMLPLALLYSGADAQQTADLAGGEAVFTKWCAPCHSPGPGMPGTQALAAKYGGTLPAVLTERTDLTPEAIGVFVRNGVTVMPFFRKTEISDEDLAALAAYVVDTARSN